MKLRVKGKEKVVRVLLAENEFGAIVADEFVSINDPKLGELSEGRAFVDVKRLEQGAGMSLMPLIARIRANLDVPPDAWDQLGRGLAPSVLNVGGMLDDDDSPIIWPKGQGAIEARAEILRMNPWLIFIAFEGAGAAGRAHGAVKLREARDLGNSPSSSDGTSEEVPEPSTAGSEPTPAAN